jgi:hypothetical protein
MTPEEIRSTKFDEAKGPTFDQTLRFAMFKMLREITAQLAEQNQSLREDRLQRKAVIDEERTARMKRDEIFASTATGFEALRGTFSPPAATPVRVEYPGTVAHLGCIIREPDGAYKVATNQGELLDLSEADYQRIFAPPCNPEVKPS